MFPMPIPQESTRPQPGAPAVEPTVLADCQSQQDYRRIRIDKVGVKALRYPIIVRDKVTQEPRHTVAILSLAVDLPEHFKGTHMSRFVEILNASGPEMNVERIPVILRELQKRLHAEAAHITMEFPYFIEKQAPVTGARGLVDYQIKLEGSIYGNDIDVVQTVVVPVTTLCPCSKSISKYGAHNQRGYVSLAARYTGTVWFEDLIELIERSASAPIYSLLKRPDEKFVTEQAYENPVFVEDLVRNVAVRCNAHPEITWYRVEAENMESIHNHSAYACIEKPVE